MILIGDTHGIKPVFNAIEKYKIENENIIHVGDVGLGFEEIQRDVKNLQLLEEALLDTNNKFYCIRGNHDNPIFWEKNRIHLPKFHNIVLCEDYSIHEIEGKDVFFLGGGISVDRTYRRDMNPPSYWKDEEIVFDFKNSNLKRNIDIIVTHSCPDFCEPIGCNAHIVNEYAKIEMHHGMNLKSDLTEERNNLTKIYDEILKHSDPKYYFYGHMHMSTYLKKDGVEFIGLNINEIKEI